jgi:hypothetical protein
MRHRPHRAALGGLAGLVVAWPGITVAAAAENGGQASSGAVVQSIPPPVSQNPSIPPLNLTDAQRAKIRQALSSRHTEVSFALKSAKPSKDFEPSVGAKIPSGLKPLALPRPLIYEMPLLRRYAYLKFKHEVLIVNPMTRKIVDMFPEAGSG